MGEDQETQQEQQPASTDSGQSQEPPKPRTMIQTDWEKKSRDPSDLETHDGRK